MGRSPDAIAFHEVEGLKAYYSRDWIGMCRLMLRMLRILGLSRRSSLEAASCICIASAAWKSTNPAMRSPSLSSRLMSLVYSRSKKETGWPRAEAAEAAHLEVEYWRAHRAHALYGGTKDELIRSLTSLHQALYGVDAEAAALSARHRAHATIAIDRFVNGETRTAPWSEARLQMEECYRVLAEKLDS